MIDPDRGETQTAWQVVLSSGASVVWDSGKTTATSSSSVPYAGPPLTPATKYSWKVKLWDKDENESPFSAECDFHHRPFEIRLDRGLHLGWHVQ